MMRPPLAAALLAVVACGPAGPDASTPTEPCFDSICSCTAFSSGWCITSGEEGVDFSPDTCSRLGGDEVRDRQCPESDLGRCQTITDDDDSSFFVSFYANYDGSLTFDGISFEALDEPGLEASCEADGDHGWSG